MYKSIRWILLLLILLLYLTPFLLSTPWGSHLIFNRINRKIPGHIEADSLKLRWFSSQAIRKLKVYGKEGALIFEVDEIRTELNLWRLLWGNFHFGKTHVMHPYLILEEKGSEGESKGDKITKNKQAPSKSRKISGELHLVDGTFLAQNRRLEKGALNGVNGDMRLTWPKEASFTLNAEAASKHGRGQVEGQGIVTLTKPKHTLAFKASFPGEIVARFVAIR